MSTAYDVIVIGGGIIGASCSYYLSCKGKKVLLLEKGEFGSGASGSCDDLIFLQSKKPDISLEMALESLDIYRSLSYELDMDLEFCNPGGMILVENPEYLHVMEEYANRQRGYGLPVEILNRADTKKKIPYIGDTIVASTYSPIDAQINPLKVVFGYLRKAKDMGATISKNAEVSQIIKKTGGHWQVITSSGEAFESEAVVNACGAWASKICGMIGEEVPIRPKRGQLVLTEAVPSVSQCNLLSAGYIVSKLRPELFKANIRKNVREMGLGFSFSRTAEGKYLIGSTREYVGFNKGTTFEALQLIVAQATSFFPVLKKTSIIRHFAGLRPATDDGRAVIGELSGHEGFFMAAGHEGDGIALAPITGRIISSLICGQHCSYDLDELSPDRFRPFVQNSYNIVEAAT